MKIRRATAGDAPTLARLLTHLGYPTAAETIPDRLAHVEREGGIVFVAVEDAGAPIGFASVARLATLQTDGQVAYITALVTAPEARGRGVGRALVAAIESWARECGCVRLSVTSAEHRADAHEFYPRCGLPYTGRRFSKPLHTPTS